MLTFAFTTQSSKKINKNAPQQNVAFDVPKSARDMEKNVENEAILRNAVNFDEIPIPKTLVPNA